MQNLEMTGLKIVFLP